MLLAVPALVGLTLFPTASSPPAEVVAAQLEALRQQDIQRVFDLFSRARRAVFTEHGRAQGGGQALVDEAARLRRVEAALEQSCPGLLGHSTAEILSTLQVQARERGRLPQWCCRVRTATSPDEPDNVFTFTLTQQHDPPPTAHELANPTILNDDRNAARFDGFDKCWFVWSIQPDGGGGQDGIGAPDPESARDLPTVTR